MAELDFERGSPDEFRCQPIESRRERTSTHFIVSDEIFQSTHVMRRHDMLAGGEKYTPEDAYRIHVQQISGADAEPTTPFMELSDMAIQMYETEADIMNRQHGLETQD